MTPRSRLALANLACAQARARARKAPKNVDAHLDVVDALARLERAKKDMAKK
jgi:hypothetical protein